MESIELARLRSFCTTLLGLRGYARIYQLLLFPLYVSLEFQDWNQQYLANQRQRGRKADTRIGCFAYVPAIGLGFLPYLLTIALCAYFLTGELTISETLTSSGIIIVGTLLLFVGLWVWSRIMRSVVRFVVWASG